MYTTNDVPKWGWLWLAFLPLVLLIIGRFLISDPSTYDSIFNHESGLIENLTVALLIPAAAFALLCAKRFWKAGFHFSSALLIIYALGCLILFGEELSWGQHIFKWETPDYFLKNNKQLETNFHNLHGSHRGLHKMLLVIGIAVGGIIVPLWAKWKGMNYLPSKHWIIWLVPTWICLPVSLFVFVSHFYVKITKWIGAPEEFRKFYFELPEVVELYIAFFLLFYALSLYLRLSQSPHLDSKKLVIGP